MNIHRQIITIDISEDNNEPLVLINPSFEVIDEALEEMQEGCLSVPGYYEEVRRPNHIRVKSLDQEGNPIEFDAHDLLAVCIQHEIDHLNGKLFVDYLSRLKRDRIRSKLEKKHKLEKAN